MGRAIPPDDHLSVHPFLAAVGVAATLAVMIALCGDKPPPKDEDPNKSSAQNAADPPESAPAAPKPDAGLDLPPAPAKKKKKKKRKKGVKGKLKNIKKVKPKDHDKDTLWKKPVIMGEKNRNAGGDDDIYSSDSDVSRPNSPTHSDEEEEEEDEEGEGEEEEEAV